MPFAAVGPRDLHYELTGDGPPLVLVMGVGGEAWRPLLPLFEGYRTLTYDNAGVGLTRDRATGAPPEPPYATEGLADDLAWLLRALELGPAHVVGVSMGGAIAMHLAAREPSLVRTLTLCATWPRADGLLRQVFAFREDLLERLGPEGLLRYVSLFAWGPPSWEAGGVAVAATRRSSAPALPPGTTASEEELIAWCSGRIASFKVPRHVRFVDEWPMSATKIQRFRLREQLVAELGA